MCQRSSGPLNKPGAKGPREDFFYYKQNTLEAVRAGDWKLHVSKNGKPVLNVPSEVMNKLVDYPWPGNVRELENAIERAVVLSRSDSLQLSDLPEAVSQSDVTSIEALTFPIGTPLDEVEHRLIRETMKYTSGDKALAAQLLGISTRTIYRKLGDAEGGTRTEPE